MKKTILSLIILGIVLSGCAMNKTSATITYFPEDNQYVIKADAGSKVSFKKNAAGDVDITWDDKKDQMTWRELLMLMLTKPDVNISN